MMRNLITSSWAWARPRYVFHRLMMRDALRMRTSLTSRSILSVRSVLPEPPSPPLMTIMTESYGIVAITSMANDDLR